MPWLSGSANFLSPALAQAALSWCPKAVRLNQRQPVHSSLRALRLGAKPFFSRKDAKYAKDCNLDWLSECRRSVAFHPGSTTLGHYRHFPVMSFAAKHG